MEWSPRPGLWRNTFNILLHPGRSVPPLAETNPTRAALLYAGSLVGLGVGAATLFSELFAGASGAKALSAAIPWALAGTVIGLLNLLISAAIVHLALRVMRGATQPWPLTLRAAALSHASYVLCIVPGAGLLLASLVYLVVLARALRRVHSTSLWKTSVGAVAPLGAAFAFALSLRVLVIEAYKVPSASGVPSVLVQEYLFAWKFSLGPRYGELAIFRYPGPGHAQDFLKRVVALPGDELHVESGRPVINGWTVPRCRVGETSLDNRGYPTAAGTTGTVFVEFLGESAYLVFLDEAVPATEYEGTYVAGKDQFLVLGDNRNHSADSRNWSHINGGGVPLENLRARPFVVWMSFDPSGRVAWDRLGVALDRPTLPPGMPPTMVKALDDCLRHRPPPSEATPPRQAARAAP